MTPSRSLSTVLLLTAALLVAGCEQRGALAPKGPTTRTWTLRHLREQAVADQALASWPAREWITPRGQLLRQWSPPYHRFERLQPAEYDGLNVLPAFSEAKPAAFTVVEVWERVPEVWVQPWYVLVTKHDPANPGAHRLQGALPLVDIGEESLFYSPFWELTYVVVPEGTPPDRYTHATDLLGLPMYRGGGLLAPLTPPDVLPVVDRDGRGSLRPLSEDAVGGPGRGEAWLRGQRVTYLDFGANAFAWNTSAARHGVVDKAALYLFAHTDEKGHVEPLGLPAVIGTGPHGADRGARRSASGLPKSGALTRPHFALLPRGAGPFIPSGLGALKESLRARGVTVVDAHPSVENLAEAKDYVLRVALNPECFKDLVGFPRSCRWLDSQAAVEAHLESSAVLPQDVLFTSPILYFDGRPLGR